VTLPNFLVIGAAKSGTTSLFRYLDQHPDIFMTPLKETLFFAPDCRKGADDGAQQGVSTLEAYEALFEGAEHCKAIGEASPQYLYSSVAAGLVKDLIPTAKLVAVLRHPAERAYSAFLHLVRDGVEPITDFRQALAAESARRDEGRDPLWLYTDVSHYYGQLCRFLDQFPPDQLQVHLYEDFEEDPGRVVQQVFAFVGVDQTFVPNTALRFNPGGLPRSRLVHRAIGTDSRTRRALLGHLPKRFGLSVVVNGINRNLVKPQIPDDVRLELVHSFAREVDKLEELLHRDLSRWRT
jgi:hypothetical protein